MNELNIGSCVEKPRILLLCDRPGWAFDICARNLVAHLSSRFTFDIFYVVDQPEIDQDVYDLVYVFWWGERYHRRFVTDLSKIVKEVSSHRWEIENLYGNHTPHEAVERYMHDAEHLVVTSRRLQELFNSVHPSVQRYRLGVDTSRFFPMNLKQGDDIKVGWAGNESDLSKGLHDILLPACGVEYHLLRAGGDQSHDMMPEFYNQLDVICVASAAEGTPLPLIEAMACGCFPISTAVGVAPELIKHGVNGLIVERTSQSFRNALDWCKDNLALVRKAGFNNAELIQNEWSGTTSSQQFAEILDNFISSKKSMRPKTSIQKSQNDNGYARHFARINPDNCSDSAYISAACNYQEDIEALLPESHAARIIEIGTGHGHFLRYLLDKGYERVSGIDISPELMSIVRRQLAHRVEFLSVDEGGRFLDEHPDTYDCIVMLDVIEHVTLSDAGVVLRAACKALRPNGRIIIRTPNMANLLGGYSLFMDLTHCHGYTEWSLIHLLEECGFQEPRVRVPSRYASKLRHLRVWLVQEIHRQFYRLNDRVPPLWFGKNIIVTAESEQIKCKPPSFI